MLALCIITALFAMSLLAGAAPVHGDYEKIHAFLDAMQSPKNCTGIDYVWSDMGCGGGFAAHFQLAAAEWMRAAAITQYRMPVLIIGSIRKYSEGQECKHVGGDWTCFFMPVSRCQEELKRSGKQVQVDLRRLTTFDDNIIPLQFRHVGIAYWWGIVQERMFRLQPIVRQYIIDEASAMNSGKGFPGVTPESLEPEWLLKNGVEWGRAKFPLAGLHVRHGDKHNDGFKHHSMESELRALQASPQCAAAPNSTTVTESSGNCWIQTVHGSMHPLPVYVASDNADVLSAAARMGHLTVGRGVSQASSSAGMFAMLHNKPEMGYNASLEIIRDVLFLSRCSTLVGISASQIFRMAVGISNATGTLVSATAMDYAQIPRVAQMSAKYFLPLVEFFSRPPAAK